MKKTVIIALSVYIIILALVFSFLGLRTGVNLLILPIRSFADICYVTLPITCLSVFIISIITLSLNDFEKFNKLYAYLLSFITIGVFSSLFEDLFSSSSVFSIGDYIKMDLLVLGIVSVLSTIIFFYLKKDTRLFLILVTISILFFLYNTFTVLI